jgi:hypothetical protein
VAGVLLGVILVLLAFDWLQTRASIDPATRRAIDIGSLKSLAKHFWVGVALLWLGRVGWRESRPVPHGQARRSAPLIH